MYQPQKKYKANHSGYRKRPTGKEVLGLMTLYMGIDNVALMRPVKKQVGVQLKLEL